MTITEILAGYYTPDTDGRRRPESLYGAAKMWAHLQRQGIPVAKCTVADPAAARAPDLVVRQFSVDAPNRLLVGDFTYVLLVTGVFVYTAFVVDAYAGRLRCGPARGTRWSARRFIIPMVGRNTPRCTAVGRSCSLA